MCIQDNTEYIKENLYTFFTGLGVCELLVESAAKFEYIGNFVVYLDWKFEYIGNFVVYLGKKFDYICYIVVYLG